MTSRLPTLLLLVVLAMMTATGCGEETDPTADTGGAAPTSTGHSADFGEVEGVVEDFLEAVRDDAEAACEMWQNPEVDFDDAGGCQRALESSALAEQLEDARVIAVDIAERSVEPGAVFVLVGVPRDTGSAWAAERTAAIYGSEDLAADELAGRIQDELFARHREVDDTTAEALAEGELVPTHLVGLLPPPADAAGDETWRIDLVGTFAADPAESTRGFDLVLPELSADELAEHDVPVGDEFPHNPGELEDTQDFPEAEG